MIAEAAVVDFADNVADDVADDFAVDVAVDFAVVEMMKSIILNLNYKSPFDNF